MNLNLMAAVRMTRAVLSGDRSLPGSGAIVTTSSVNAFLPDPAVIDYSAPKAAAVANFSKSLSAGGGAAQHPGQHGEPRPRLDGPVARYGWRGADRGVGDRWRRCCRRLASRRGCGDRPLHHPREEAADLMVFLASARAANVTGADFTIDGGLIKTL